MYRIRNAAMILLAGLFLTLISPIWFSDINVYSDTFPGGNIRYPHWYRYGGFYPWYQYHPAWPQYNLPEERQFRAVGFALSLIMWSAIAFVCYGLLNVLRTLLLSGDSSQNDRSRP